MPIHATAIVDPAAEIATDVTVGPYVVIDGPVVVGARTRIAAHATLCGHTTIGEENEIHMGAVIGNTPQDRGYAGEESFVKIGSRNIFREHVQIHRGTGEGTTTSIGDDNFLMATAHVAHNGTVGNHVTMANGAVIGGHATVEDRVFLSASCAVHQHVRVGALAFLRGLSAVDRDVPPFAMVDQINVIRGLNRVGLQRAGFSRDAIAELRRLYRRLFARRCNLSLAIGELEKEGLGPEANRVLAFIRTSERGVCRGPVGS